jgi:diadenosine tetraphosphate (Ap4A) HIT family hydrolase
MGNNGDHLKELIQRLRTVGFWERVFNWRKIKEGLVDAMGDLQRMLSSNEQLRQDNVRLDKDLASKTETASNFTARNTELQAELAGIKQKLGHIEGELKRATEHNTQLLQESDFRKQEHSNAISSLKQIQDQIAADRTRELEERNRLELERREQLKASWSHHEQLVKDRIKSICSKHTIEYVDKVPFKGAPDNTVKICDEFVVFDAKCPAGEDQRNFPSYLKDQAEKAKKYTQQEFVKPEIFLVVPSNTLEGLEHFVYRLADYSVFVISVDSLEPVILSLQKLEDYEFAEQLSPEERENICRVLGKFAHLSKRRIQVDGFFAKQFIELAYKCESDLPADIHDKVIEFERAEKLNPPIEKRARQISIKDLEKDTVKLLEEASSKGIQMQDLSAEVNGWPLYKDNKED